MFVEHQITANRMLCTVCCACVQIWGGALRVCWVWHITWFVNSATHSWGYQDYDSGDLSKNNWCALRVWYRFV